MNILAKEVELAINDNPDTYFAIQLDTGWWYVKAGGKVFKCSGNVEPQDHMSMDEIKTIETFRVGYKIESLTDAIEALTSE